MLKINKLDLLIAFYIGCIALSELMGGKTFFIADLGFMNLNSSVAIFVLPIIFTINDIITEVYGKERTRSIIRSGLLVIFFIMVFSFLAVNLPPSTRFTASEKAYDGIFGLTMRIAAASLISFAIAEFTDVLIFVKIRERLGKKALWLRNNISNFISQLADTALFMFLAFYSLNKPLEDNLLFLIGLILPYWLLKCLMSIIETPFVYLGVKWLKKNS